LNWQCLLTTTCTGSRRRRPMSSSYRVRIGDSCTLSLVVEGVDESLVVLVDCAPLHFLRRSELSFLDGEVVLDQADLFRNLEVRGGRELLVHFLLHLRLDRR